MLTLLGGSLSRYASCTVLALGFLACAPDREFSPAQGDVGSNAGGGGAPATTVGVGDVAASSSTGIGGGGETAAAPKRVLFFHTPHGVIRDAWLPTGTESNFSLGPILAPLEPFKSSLLIVDGIDNR